MTLRVAATAAVGRVTVGELDVIYLPDSGYQARRPVLLFHGQLRTATDWIDSAAWPGSTALAVALARCGLLVIAGSWGGPAWGNPTADADVEAARTLAGTLGARTDRLLLLGASMGACEALTFAAQYPAEVAAGVGVIPAVNVGYARDNDTPAGVRANINTAFGLPVGSTSATDPLPAFADPYDPTTARAIAAPFRFYGSSGDATAPWPFTTDLAFRIGAPAVDVSPAGGHTDATIGAAPVADICRHLFAHSTP